MKNLYFIVLLVFFSFNLRGQITIPTTHMPTIGDVFTFGVHNNTYSPKPLSAGVYDFSDLVQGDTTVFRYVANDKTFEYPNANLKMTEDDNDPATVFFKKSGNDLFVISLGQFQEQFPVPGVGLLSLKGTMKYSTFPMTNTTNITSSDDIKLTIPKSLFQGFNIDSMLQGMIPGLPTGSQLIVDSLALEIKMSMNLKADGSGKIKTPIDNNIDVLKIVRVLSGTPKIMLYGKAKIGTFLLPLTQDVTAFLSGQLPLDNLNATTHTFYSPSFRQEIVTATLDSLGKYQTVNYRYRTKNGTNTTQIHSTSSKKLDFDFSGGQLTVYNILPGQFATLHVYTPEGRKIYEKSVSYTDFKLKLDIPSPIFLVQLVSGDQIIQKKLSIE